VQLLEDDYTILTASDGAAVLQLAEHARPGSDSHDLSLQSSMAGRATRRIKANAVL